MLYFKGFQAIQCQRVAHWLWRKGRKVGGQGAGLAGRGGAAVYMST